MHDTSAVTTFLFTDIEGSARLWEQEPERMQPALACHDALARTAVECHHGTVVKTTGDGLCAAFDQPLDAIGATLQLQQALADPEATNGVALRVRCGLHLGVVERRDNDYFGNAVNRTARIMGVAHGGQVIVSQAVADRVADRLPAAVALRDLGAVRLKNLARPERVYQVIHPQLRQDFPALRSLEATPNNLPQQITSFVGRERALAEVRQLLSNTRFLTMTGVGGLGKTRLSLQVGAEVLDDYADGVWFVELAPLSDARLVPKAVASVLGVKEEPGMQVQDALLKFVKDRQLLLILDNCEHLAHACAELAKQLLQSGPQVKVLASSRESLHVVGETTYPLSTLEIPDPKHDLPVAALTQYEAVHLFGDRALAAQPVFRVNRENAAAVAAICHCLDGIPLALELAAARVRALSVETIAERLSDRFHLLTGGDAASLPRLQTLRACIDWSYDLLTEPERVLLGRLAVFAGGWTLAAAEAVGTSLEVDTSNVLGLLTRLVEKSLVEFDAEGARYRLLETVRQYARDRLEESVGGAAVRERHLDYFLALAEEAEPKLTGAEQAEWMQRLEEERENLRASLEWSLNETGSRGGLRLCGALQWFWRTRGYFSEGREWCVRILEKAGGEERTAERAKVLSAAGVMARLQGDYSAARALCEESLAIAQELGDRGRIAADLHNLGVVAHNQGDYPAARALYEESLAIKRELGDQWGIASSLNNLANVAQFQRDYPVARELHEESLAIRRELGDQLGISDSLNNLGLVAKDLGDFASARALHEESLAIRRKLRARERIPSSLNNLGNVAHYQGDYAAARALHEEGLAIRRELGDRLGIAESLNSLGMVAHYQGDYPAAEALYEEGLAIMQELGDKRGIADSLEGQATLVAALGGSLHAARIWGAVERLRAEISSPIPPNERPRYDQCVAAARATLGDDAAFDRAWQEGRALTFEQAIEFALQQARTGGLAPT